MGQDPPADPPRGRLEQLEIVFFLEPAGQVLLASALASSTNASLPPRATLPVPGREDIENGILDDFVQEAPETPRRVDRRTDGAGRRAL